MARKYKHKQKQKQSQSVKQTVIVKLDGEKRKVKRRYKRKPKVEQKEQQVMPTSLPPNVVYQSSQYIPYSPQPEPLALQKPVTEGKPIFEDVGVGTEGFVKILDMPTKKEQLETMIIPVSKQIPVAKQEEAFQKKLKEKQDYFTSQREPMGQMPIPMSQQIDIMQERARAKATEMNNMWEENTKKINQTKESIPSIPSIPDIPPQFTEPLKPILSMQQVDTTKLEGIKIGPKPIEPLLDLPPLSPSQYKEQAFEIISKRAEKKTKENIPSGYSSGYESAGKKISPSWISATEQLNKLSGTNLTPQQAKKQYKNLKTMRALIK